MGDAGEMAREGCASNMGEGMSVISTREEAFEWRCPGSLSKGFSSSNASMVCWTNKGEETRRAVAGTEDREQEAGAQAQDECGCGLAPKPALGAYDVRTVASSQSDSHPRRSPEMRKATTTIECDA